MFGAAAWAGNQTGSFLVALLAGTAAAAVIGMLVEAAILRRLYARDHLDQVVATFGLILFFNEAATMLFGRQPLFAQMPPWLAGSVELLPGVPYPAYRLAIIAVGLLVALALYLLVARTRLGMLIRAGNSDREMVRALGVDIGLVYTLVFGLGALLAGLAGVMAGPVFSVQVGMGEQVLILTFVVIIIGGIGSVRGAFIGALLVGMVDTLTRAFLPGLLKTLLSTSDADAVGGGVSSMAVYVLMAAILLWRPRGLFPAHG